MSAIMSLLAAVAASISQPATSPASGLCRPTGIQQLRIYEIFDNNKAAFHDRFRDHALRIMKRHGFEIISIWETRHEGKTEFTYLLQWPDEATMKKQWAAFMADQEWSGIKRETGAVHGRMVGSIEDRQLAKMPYSPC